MSYTHSDNLQVADAVHAQGSFIYLQILSLGRIGVPAILKSKGHDYVAPSAIPVSPESEVPRELTLAEIEEYIELYGVAAENAIFKAGFDGQYFTCSIRIDLEDFRH